MVSFPCQKMHTGETATPGWGWKNRLEPQFFREKEPVAALFLQVLGEAKNGRSTRFARGFLSMGGIAFTPFPEGLRQLR